MRRARSIALLLMMTAIVATPVPLALALSHHALEVLVGHHPPLGWNATRQAWPHWALLRSRANSRRFFVKWKSVWRPRRWELPAPRSWPKASRNRLTFQQLFARGGLLALNMPQHEAPVHSSKIVPHGAQYKPRYRHYRNHIRPLTVTQLDRSNPGWRQQARDLGRNRTIGVKPIHAAVKCQLRLITRHL